MDANRLGMINLCAVLALAATLAAAPQERGATPPSVASPRLIQFDSLAHAPVVVVAASPDRSGERTTNEKLDAPVQLTVVGTLRDLVIDTETSHSTFAIVDTIDGGRALPMNQLEWDDADRRWILRDKDAMARAMPCDGVSLARLHETRAKGSETGEHDGGGTVDVTATGAARRDVRESRYVLASLFGRRELMARDGRAGAGLGVVIEVRGGALAFLRVATERGDLAVPFAALQIAGATGTTEAHRVHVDRDKAQLDTAPTLGTDPKWTLDNAKFRADLYRFFGVRAPAFDAKAAAAGSVARNG